MGSRTHVLPRLSLASYPYSIRSLAVLAFTLVDYCCSHTKSVWETVLILTSMSCLSPCTHSSSHRPSGLLPLICSLFIYLETRSHVSQADLKRLTSQTMGTQMCITTTCSSLSLNCQTAVDHHHNHYTQTVQCAPGSHWFL